MKRQHASNKRAVQSGKNTDYDNIDYNRSIEKLKEVIYDQQDKRRDQIDRRSALRLLGVVSAGSLSIGMGAADSSRGEDTENDPENVKILEPEGAIEPTATWSVGTRAGNRIYVAGMRGIDPDTNELVEGPEERIRQGFENMQHIAESAGATLDDTARIVVYVTDMHRYRPLVNETQEELWGDDSYPPRTIIEVDRLNQDDIFEVEGTFYAPEEDRVEILKPEGAIEPTATWNVGARAGDLVYVAGMRGIDPETDELAGGSATGEVVDDPEKRIRQGFENMQHIAESEGTTLRDTARIVVHVTDMYRYRPLVNEIQGELWGDDPYPPRTIVEIDRLNQDDIFEVTGTFYKEDIKILKPEGAIEPTATWNVGARAGDLVYVAGMRGIDPETNELVEGPEERIRQGFENMQHIAESEGATLRDTARIVVYVTDMYRYRPLVNDVQEELWEEGTYPARTIIEVDRLNQDDIFEVEGTFYAPEK